ncbi:MAG: GNAT family N-acetyltransferase [Clostridia bacterium]|nr:GNAT family N-acetyltransferase [Clostridia bacterium]
MSTLKFEELYTIELLKLEDYSKCSSIWDMEKHKELADKFYQELLSGNRITYVCKDGGEFIGEISLVKEMNDTDYTIPNQRVYVSHLIVKPEYRRQGIGKMLVDFITDKAKELGYSEMSIGVDMDNYPALKLYTDCGFNKVVYIGEDEQGKYIKLLNTI